MYPSCWSFLEDRRAMSDSAPWPVMLSCDYYLLGGGDGGGDDDNDDDGDDDYDNAADRRFQYIRR